MLTITELQEILPQEYPFLLIAKVLEIQEGKKIVAVKNVTTNEHFFEGHFPTNPVMPGVLILEAMAQVAGSLVLSNPANKGKIAYFMGIDKARFRRPVLPGDTLQITVEVTKCRGTIWCFKASASVGDSVAADAELMATIMDK